MPVSKKQAAYLDAMGVTRWVEQGQAPFDPGFPEEQAPMPESPEQSRLVSHPSSLTPDANEWEDLQAEVASCQRCPLHETRTQTVFGVGHPKARLMIIGEAPGADEDRQGEPFVGRAGQLLNEMLRAIDLDRQTVYIANILKCRPPNNRDPKPEEAAACVGYLYRQIAYIQPKLILALGRVAAQRLLKTDTTLGKLRGKLHQLPDIDVPFIVTYHPAYLLRSPLDKRKAWQDLLFALKTINS